MPMQGPDLIGHPSPTGRRILFGSRTDTTSTGCSSSSPSPLCSSYPVEWTLVDTDSLGVLDSWEETPRGRVNISDSKMATIACVAWFFKCNPEIDVRDVNTGWRKIADIEDRRHPGVAGFIDDDLLVLLGHTTTLLKTDGTVLFTENSNHEGCWWGEVYPSAGERRFVIPSCKLKGRIESLDIGGYDELSQVLVYDAPYHGQSYTLNIKGAKIKDLSLLALSPDGSKLG